MDNEVKDVKFGDKEILSHPDELQPGQCCENPDVPNTCLMRLLLPSGNVCELWGAIWRAFEIDFTQAGKPSEEIQPIPGKAVFIKHTAYHHVHREDIEPVTLEYLESALASEAIANPPKSKAC